MSTPSRTRTISWSDPLATAAAGRKLSGPDFLRTVIRGELPPPPIAATLGLALTEAADGLAVFTMEPGEHQFNPRNLSRA